MQRYLTTSETARATFEDDETTAWASAGSVRTAWIEYELARSTSVGEIALKLTGWRERWPDLAWLERELAAGRVGILGEMGFNYSGVHPDDARMSPYWAMAAKYDVPMQS